MNHSRVFAPHPWFPVTPWDDIDPGMYEGWTACGGLPGQHCRLHTKGVLVHRRCLEKVSTSGHTVDCLFHSSFKPSVFPVQNVDIESSKEWTFTLRCRCTVASCPNEVAPLLCHVSVEGVFGFPYIKAQALLCALNGIHNITELMLGCLVLGLDQSLS